MKLHTLQRQLSTHDHRSIPSQTAFAFPETAIRSAIAIAAVCFLFLLGSSNLFAQAQVDTGGLTGTVTDTSGAVIPGAVVTIKNIATGVATKGLTTSTGRYIFGAVAPGTYTLEVIKTGFGPYSASGIVVHIQQIPTVDVVLNPGAVSQTVTVSDAVPLMQAESAEVKQTITGAAVNDLPLSTRDWTSLGQLSAGVTTTAGGTTSSSYYSVNGQSFNQNDFRLNGIDDNVEMFPLFSSRHQCCHPPTSGRDPGIYASERRFQLGIRTFSRRHRKCRCEVRNEQGTWRRLGISAERGFQRERLLL